MENMAKILQMLMASNASDSGNIGNDNSENDVHTDAACENNSSDSSDSDDGGFDGFFDNINFDMISRMGELFSQFNKPDRNAELLLALKPHLRNENRHKVDTAIKISRMISMYPFLKDSGILNDLF
jgi:hypothetical protein